MPAISLGGNNGERDKTVNTLLPVLIGITLAFASAAGGAEKTDKEVLQLSIERKSLRDALNDWAQQTGYQLIAEIKGDFVAPRVKGRLTAQEALEQLLKGSPLTYQWIGERLVAVREQPRQTSTPGKEQTAVRVARLSGDELERVHRAADDQRGAQNTQGSRNERRARDAARDIEGLEEVVVTAQKRQERLIDVPQSVSVLSARELAKIGAVQFQDFANVVPGLSFQTAGAASTQITLRGVTTGFDVGPTVGIYVDEVPYGSSSAFALGAQAALDVALFDIDRIEVLRGPQGTLYGASTMGGLLKYVSKRPDTSDLDVHVQTGVSNTVDGDFNYNGAAVVNAPIGANKIAMRASGFYSRDAGYIDNLALLRERANRSDIYGGRIDLLFAPTEALSIRVGGLLQNISRDGQSTVEYSPAGEPQYGSLTQFRRFAEPSYQRFRLASATASYDFGPATLMSISSYQTADSESVWDISAVYVPLLASALGRSYSAVSDPLAAETNKFTQEIRLSDSSGRPFEWVLGGFYTEEDSRYTERFDLLSPAGEPAPNDLYAFRADSTYEEYAAFGDLTWHPTDTFSVTGGARYAHNSQTYAQIGEGLFIGSRPRALSDESVVTYLANARYRFGDQATAYLRYATGYRPGGPNISANDPVTGLPLGQPTFDADRLKSYEIGYKGTTDDQRIGIDIAGYYIDWTDIQILAIRGGFALRANAPGGAIVRGAELTLTTRPVTDLSVAGAFAYTDARMSEADADLGAAKDERLPNVPQFTAAVNVDYELPLRSVQSTIGATLRYVDERMASFNRSMLPQHRLPDYTTVDLRAGLTFEAVALQFYVRNLLDERGQLSSMLPQFGTRIAILQPRTIGVSLTSHF